MSDKVATNESVSVYRRAHQGMPRKITKVEEYDLIRKAQAGDINAETRLIRQNIPFVFMLAREYKGFECPFEDLVQEGMMGLSRAIRSFDISKDVRLSTYGSWWIHAHIGRYTRVYKTTVDGPSTVSYGKEFPVIRVSSLNAPISASDDESTTAMDLLEDEDSPSPEEVAEISALSWKLRAKLDRMKRGMTAVQIDVLENRLLKEDPDKLGEVGSRHNLSRERIRQIEKELLRIFKTSLEGYKSAA